MSMKGAPDTPRSSNMDKPVDDSAGLRALCREVLAKNGYELLSASFEDGIVGVVVLSGKDYGPGPDYEADVLLYGLVGINDSDPFGNDPWMYTDSRGRPGRRVALQVPSFFRGSPGWVIRDAVLQAVKNKTPSDAFCDYVSNRDFIAKMQDDFIRAVVPGSVPSGEGEYRSLNDAYARELKAGRIEDDPLIALVWSQKALGDRISSISYSFAKVIVIDRRLDSPRISQEALDYVVFLEVWKMENCYDDDYTRMCDPDLEERFEHADLFYPDGGKIRSELRKNNLL
jgi:hypothetical protein